MECTEDLQKRDGSFEHVPKLIYAQQMCTKCEAMDDLSVYCEQYGKRIHAFWQDLVGNIIIYGCPDNSRTRFMLFHTTHGYDAQFLLSRFLALRWAPQMIMNGSKILSMVVENPHFLDSLNYLPLSLRSMTKILDLTCKKVYYHQFFNTAKNLDYVGSYPEPKYYGANYMLGDERSQFSVWYEGARQNF